MYKDKVKDKKIKVLLERKKETVYLDGKFDQYIFKLAWGVRCFDIRLYLGLYIL